METVVPTSVEDALPTSFPKLQHASIQQQFQAQHQSFAIEWQQFYPAWVAVTRRFLACSEHSDAFVESLRHFPIAGSPEYPERYIQDREVFEFFVAGLSSLENFCYAAYAIGACFQAGVFPIHTKRDLYSISPETTRDRFKHAFPGEPLTAVLKTILGHATYEEWKRIRNSLIHHCAPARNLSPPPGPAYWRFSGFEIEIGPNATTSRLAWLSTALTEVHDAALAFLSTNPF